jgi:hypothetical protein
MTISIEEAIRTLKDKTAGWVSRRDAALSLGEVAQLACKTLIAYQSEEDVDVRRGVDEALEKIGVPASGGVNGAPKLEDLVRACERRGKRTMAPHGKGYLVTVDLPGGRTQRVRVKEAKSRDGRPTIRVYTRCGIADEKTRAWAMQANAHLLHAAFATVDDDDGEMLVLVRNFDRTRVDAEDLKACIKEIAFYGDWMESKLTSEDQH